FVARSRLFLSTHPRLKCQGRLDQARRSMNVLGYRENQSRISAVRKLALAAFCDGVVLRALGEICVQVGRSFYLIRKWHHAATAFEAALSLHASSPEWHYQLGRARERLELWEKAASAYEA